MTPWGWGVGPRSPTYSETDLPQGQVPGYPPPADVPGSHSSLGITRLVARTEQVHDVSHSVLSFH
jgi:hypothetical protein